MTRSSKHFLGSSSLERDFSGDTYESFLDFLTLLSFILIVAAYHFVMTAADRPNVPTVESYFAGRGSGPSPQKVDKICLIYIYREAGIDYIKLVLPGEKPIAFPVSVPLRTPVLAENVAPMKLAKEINIVMYWHDERPSAVILEEMQRWLTEEEMPSYKVLFAGKYGNGSNH